MRYGLGIGLTAMLTAGAALAAPQTQTFSVTVSNAVSGRLETVPVTFRIGETNGAVERVDGQRFVPVAVKPYDVMESERVSRRRMEISPEYGLQARLKELELPEQPFAPMAFSNTLEQLKQTIRCADTTATNPVTIRPALTDTGFEMPQITLPRTNALGACMALAEAATKALGKAHGIQARVPISIGITGRDTILFMHNDDSCITRSFPVPDSFLRRFPRLPEFAAYVRERLKVDEWGNVGFTRVSGRIRVTCNTGELMTNFEADVYEQLLAHLLQPLHWTPVSCETGPHAQLYFKGAKDGDFGGLWLYRACLREGVLSDDVLEPCLFESGLSSEKKVTGPCAYPISMDTWLQGDKERGIMKECFVSCNNDGSVYRLDGSCAVYVEKDIDPTPLFAKDEDDPRLYSRYFLKGVIVPELTMRDQHISNGLAIVQAAIDAASAPTNNVRLVLNVAHAVESPAYYAKESDSSFLVVNPSHFSLNVQPLSARFISAYDALKLLSDVTGLHLIFSASNVVELVDYGSYTQRMSRVRAYLLPKQLCEDMSMASALRERLTELGEDRYQIVTCLPESRWLVVRSASGEFDQVQTLLYDMYEWFPGRFRLESREKGGRSELFLTDTYRDIVRRYRSGIGKDGKRWERLEIVK